MSNIAYNRIRRLQFEIVSNEHRKHPNVAVKLPMRSTAKAGAYDFFSPVEMTIAPHTQAMLWTDVKAKMPHDLLLMLNVRSSMGKHGIRLANTLGWVDADYYTNLSNDGNIGLLLENNGDTPFEIHPGDRIAQGTFVRYYITEDDDVSTERSGGFGSTGQ